MPKNCSQPQKGSEAHTSVFFSLSLPKLQTKWKFLQWMSIGILSSQWSQLNAYEVGGGGGGRGRKGKARWLENVMHIKFAWTRFITITFVNDVVKNFHWDFFLFVKNFFLPESQNTRRLILRRLDLFPPFLRLLLTNELLWFFVQLNNPLGYEPRPCRIAGYCIHLCTKLLVKNWLFSSVFVIPTSAACKLFHTVAVNWVFYLK